MPKTKPLPNNLLNPFLDSLRKDPARARGLKRPEHVQLLHALKSLNEAAEAVDVHVFARGLSREESEIVERGFMYLSIVKNNLRRR